MKRWNGWGEERVLPSLPAEAVVLLEQRIGPGRPPRDVTLEAAVASVPGSRLPAHPLLATDPLSRLRHARGQSLPDWVALRSGRVEAFPDAVAHPETAEEVRRLLGFASDVGASVIPHGGGTSVVGHVNAAPGPRPVLSVSMARLNSLLRFDTTSHLATFGAGVTGPDLEAQLRSRGFTLGHFPQSFEYSTLGGWVATRSSGQQSLGYGRIDDLFAGGRLEAPAGQLDLPPFPASAAGPDIRQLVLGSEGRLGVLTEATVRVSPLPGHEEWHAVFLPDWERGLEAVRQIVQSRLPLSLLRLSNAAETEAALTLGGRSRTARWFEHILAWRGAGAGKCLLLMALCGDRRVAVAGRRAALDAARSVGGVHVGGFPAARWRRDRFKLPYLRNALWESGYALDTLETAAPWSVVGALLEDVEAALRGGLDAVGERVFTFSHVSHVYPDGASLYITCLFRLAADPDETLHRWATLKAAASRAIVAGGGTISHHHGVGTDHREHLQQEKGELGLKTLRGVTRVFDPAGIMNPGKLLEECA